MISGFARLAVMAALIGLATGCGGSPEPAAPESSPESSAEASGEPGDVTLADGTEVPPAADFDAPLVPGAGDASSSPKPGTGRAAPFITPTNPDSRAGQRKEELKNKDNRDPFAIPLNIAPSVVTRPELEIPGSRLRRTVVLPQPPISIPPQVPPRVASSPASPQVSPRGGSSSPAPAIARAAAPSTPTMPSPAPSASPEPAAEASPPLPPEPSEARSIKVTGVVQVGSDYKIVIEVPGERTARYVSVGDRLSGDVLVKRVELDNLMDPLVVFEQYGQEVLKPVGEAPAEQVAVAPNL